MPLKTYTELRLTSIQHLLRNLSDAHTVMKID